MDKYSQDPKEREAARLEEAKKIPPSPWWDEDKWGPNPREPNLKDRLLRAVMESRARDTIKRYVQRYADWAGSKPLEAPLRQAAGPRVTGPVDRVVGWMDKQTAPRVSPQDVEIELLDEKLRRAEPMDLGDVDDVGFKEGNSEAIKRAVEKAGGSRGRR